MIRTRSLRAAIAPFLAIALCSSATAESASAQAATQPDWVSRLSINGRAFLRYSYETGESRKDFNEFALDRLYVILMWQPFQRARVRYTLEGGDTRATEVSLNGGSLKKSSSGNITAVTKHLYFEYQDVFGAGSFIRAGLHDLPFVPYEEDLWGYRVQGNVFADRTGYLTSADLGVGAGGRIAARYGSWQVSLVNGEGWRRSESGRHKDLHARLTVNPLAGVSPTAGRFFITAFRASGVSDDVASGPATRNRTILLTGYKNPGHFLIAGERLWTTDATTTLVGRWPSLAARPDELAQGEGFTAFTTLSPAAFGVTGAFARLDLLGRIDNIDPDDKISDNDQRRLIAGAAYHFHPQLRLLLTHESVRYGSGALKPNEARFLLQSEIRF